MESRLNFVVVLAFHMEELTIVLTYLNAVFWVFINILCLSLVKVFVQLYLSTPPLTLSMFRIIRIFASGRGKQNFLIRQKTKYQRTSHETCEIIILS
jgi:hypothetical protein